MFSARPADATRYPESGVIQNFRDKLCVITGGSSGIGYAIAERLARERARLLLVARDTTALQAAAEQLRAAGAAEVQTLSADVASDADMQKLAPAIAAMGEAADQVVNRDRKSVVEGKSVSVRVDIGGRRIIKKK